MVSQLQRWASENPNRGRTVSPIQIQFDSDTQESTVGPITGPGGWTSTPLEPPGPLAYYLWKTDPEFRAGTSAVRRTILRDTILVLTARIEKELKGHRWSRKKILEQLSAQQTAAVSPPQNTPELDEALAFLYGYQLVQIDEANRKIQFVPEDPRTWSNETPVWGTSFGSRVVYHQPGEQPISKGLMRWIQERSDEGWKVTWPISEGTLEEIKGELTSMNLTPKGPKPKKADYAEALGKATSIRHLQKCFP